ncbi:hypothetical protein LK542_10235 [Massilia sp. IC2-477]|uniref:hypothetical protein n=1 Tax=unclassified Massilia TaxID=2609279 RepID=UPI001D11EA6A|nr:MULTISPECIES: hypothetical protein [unclassified Massilia]MCC2955991.1 hypothetical protein [Massilia sp. IC2-477]MCC2970574.1 hypothetical protein [Massilia sp. IC2-476]
MKYLPLSAALALAFGLAGCAATDTPANGQKVAREESYAPVGTMIPRKNGSGLGAGPVTAVDKTQVENARAMQSNGVAGAPPGA